MTSRATIDTIEHTAREAYGRLVAQLAAYTRDIAGAEDALSDAFAAALTAWPDRGVPDRPEAWLITTAKRSFLDRLRRAETAHAASHDVMLGALERAEAQQPTGWPSTDPRLRLMFACAHPAISPDIRAPLILQTILGLNADHLGRLFLIPGKTMGQQLVRAKHKIKSAGIPFEIPDTDQLSERLTPVLDAVYGAFVTGWDNRNLELIDEATYLAELLVDVLPNRPAPLGLLALCLYQRARWGADRDAHGAFIPFTAQDTAQWDQRLIQSAERALRLARKGGTGDRYQFEAAIQSAHIHGRQTGTDVTASLLSLYEALIGIEPSASSIVGKAAVLLSAGQAAEALAALDDVQNQCTTYQPWWATYATALMKLGDSRASAAFDKAISLTHDPATASFLTEQRDGKAP